jgi:predicted RNA-binding Zn ribbon-like protein
VYVTSGNHTEQILTLEAMVLVANALLDNGADHDEDREHSEVDLRTVLDEAGFPRAAIAPEAAVRRTADRFGDLLQRIQSLPETDDAQAVLWTNAELTELTIRPSLSDHDGSELHIHWTPPSATFDDQVMADFIMALANELCDNGTKRFGRCAADDCDRLFYDASRNGSRRFCSDPRCASRTHTADHRKRKQDS